jgi:hypothetical protein
MSLADFLSRWTLFEMDHLVANLSIRTRPSFGKLLRFVDCSATFSRHGSTPATSCVVMPLKVLQVKGYYWRTYTMLLKVGYVALVNEFGER